MYKRRYIKHWQQFRREADETNGAEKEKESWSKKGRDSDVGRIQLLCLLVGTVQEREEMVT